MKIAFIVYLRGVGGAEKQVISLANDMVHRGHEVSLLCVGQNNGFFEVDENVNTYLIEDKGGKFVRTITRYLGLKKELGIILPDITINFWYSGAYLSVFSGKRVTGKVIYSERGDPYEKEYSGLLFWIRNMTMPFIDAFVFQTKAARNYFDNRIRSRSVVIPNPIHLNEAVLTKKVEKKKIIITVGRLHRQKNQKLLIDAFDIVRKSYPDYELHIYGEGELQKELNKYIVDLELQSKVFLKDNAKDILEKIKEADLFVLSSLYEGQPNVLLEALCLGVPSISTDYSPGGVDEIIHDGVNGFIVKNNDAKELAAAICKVLGNEQIKDKFGKMGLIEPDRYEAKKVYDKWEKFIVETVHE